MFETILIVAVILGSVLFALAVLAFGVALYCGWFTLPHPGPDRVPSKVPQRPT